MILGITGISGSGKHTAAQYFEKKGWVVLDADTIAHKSYRPYTHVWKAIVNEFSENILNENDSINRQKLGKIVFNAKDPDSAETALQNLNKIIHPYVKRKIKDKIHRHYRRGSDIVVVAALWEEIGLKDYCEKILSLTANPDSCSERIQKRDSISAETYQMRIKNQSEMPNPDFRLENNGSLEEMKVKMSELFLELKQ